ncbi:MAG TPA: hypothetical protein VMJ72_01935, partial [Candidatus Paceibacterota bacterium]|nr:hypothetical protein [Candidatus Paceibacterota bacterium]
PPKDPLWTCTAAAGVMNQGRNGSDFYSCYDPIIHRTNYGPITCCAGTGLPGDCFTWNSTGGGETPGPGESAAPTPPVYCVPQTQVVNIGDVAQLTASGGDGTFHWDSSGGGVIQSGGNQAVGISYTTAGTKYVTLTSGTSTAQCTVTVPSSGTPTPSGGTGLLMTKTGQNLTTGQPSPAAAVSASTDQTVRFTLAIANHTGAGVTGLTLHDEVPPGMTYYFGSLTIDGQSAGDDTITTSGLALDPLASGSMTTVQWSAVADQTGLIPVGPQASRPRASVTTTEGFNAQADMDVTVIGVGTAFATQTPAPGAEVPSEAGSAGTAGVASVSTGPGAATLVALIAAAVTALLYAGYTRSDSFRRRELEKFAKGRDPLDFRS